MAVDIPSAVVNSTPLADTRSGLLLGLIYGVLHVVGPDHLGTVMSISVAATPSRAFSVGAWWSLGHSLGMACVASLLLLLQSFFNVELHSWEHIGDYVIGVSMMLCGLYFIVREETYILENSDGSIALKACDCHGHGAEHKQSESHSEPGHCGHSLSSKRAGKKLMSYGGCNDSACKLEACHGKSAPQAEQKGVWQTVAGSLLGVAQGMCCPMGLMGLTILANLSSSSLAVFVVVFLLVSSIGTGIVALAWAQFAISNVVVSARALYRVSCGIVFVLGLTWVVANYNGVLDKLNYAERIADAVS